MADESDLTTKQHKAILALLERGSIEGAAELAGISARTLHRWLKQPGFRRAYIDAGERLFERGIGQLQRLTSIAVAKVAQCLINSTSSTAEILRASELIFVHGKRSLDMKLDARVHVEGQCGVLLTTDPVALKDWPSYYKTIKEYQDELHEQVAEADANQEGQV